MLWLDSQLCHLSLSVSAWAPDALLHEFTETHQYSLHIRTYEVYRHSRCVSLLHKPWSEVIILLRLISLCSFSDIRSQLCRVSMCLTWFQSVQEEKTLDWLLIGQNEPVNIKYNTFLFSSFALVTCIMYKQSTILKQVLQTVLWCQRETFWFHKEAFTQWF